MFFFAVSDDNVWRISFYLNQRKLSNFSHMSLPEGYFTCAHFMISNCLRLIRKLWFNKPKLPHSRMSHIPYPSMVPCISMKRINNTIRKVIHLYVAGEICSNEIHQHIFISAFEIENGQIRGAKEI